MISCVYISHKECVIGDLGCRFDRLTSLIEQLSVGDYVLLNTCNRVELYSTSEVELEGFRMLRGFDAIKHLFRVSCGLESMILGENEILSQLREAHRNAVSCGHCRGELSHLFTAAAALGAKVRSKTNISRGKTSIASLAVDYALEKRSFDEALVIGSGVIGSKIACALKNRGVKRIFLANRRRGRAERLAAKVGGVVFDYSRIDDLLVKSPVVFTATSAPHPIIRADMVSSGAGTLFVDLGVPYDVAGDVGEFENVELVRLDYFEQISRLNSLRKGEEVVKVEELIDEAIEELKIACAF